MRANLRVFPALNFRKLLFFLDHAVQRIPLFSPFSAQKPAQ